eukprot:TRINITY_DN862_c0_g1_i1.p1 TRINITY_DN862_c0_g1~~TRINITY_DN862_c0_g1_i1.p1  ORF type:complete len:327 (+),score=114.83 TRINITY_DN862_c0_g1_i1:52-1032(+)
MVIAAVTGASGFIAEHLIKKLLERGYAVRGTVRSLASDNPKANDVRQLFPAVKLFAADLLIDRSFDEAIQGADVVFHTASPFFTDFKDAQKDLVEPALQGTLNVLRSVERAGTVKRVVLTSSLAAIFGKRPEGHVYSEADWNHTSTPEMSNLDAYRYSKRVAEEAAWEFVKGKAFDLVVICPSFVIGPVLSGRADATSIKVVRGFLDGSIASKGTTNPNAVPHIDVRDVAEAHVRAYERPEAAGRYAVANKEGASHFQWAKILQDCGKFSKYKLPTHEAAPVTFAPLIDNSKTTRELGMELLPLGPSLIAMAESLIQFGIVPAAQD